MSLILTILVSVLAFGAAAGVALVRAMPRLVRISLVIPLVYFGIIHAWALSAPVGEVVRSILCSIAMALIFVSIIVNAALVIWARNKGGGWYE